VIRRDARRKLSKKQCFHIVRVEYYPTPEDDPNFMTNIYCENKRTKSTRDLEDEKKREREKDGLLEIFYVANMLGVING